MKMIPSYPQSQKKKELLGSKYYLGHKGLADLQFPSSKQTILKSLYLALNTLGPVHNTAPNLIAVLFELVKIRVLNTTNDSALCSGEDQNHDSRRTEVDIITITNNPDRTLKCRRSTI